MKLRNYHLGTPAPFGDGDVRQEHASFKTFHRHNNAKPVLNALAGVRPSDCWRHSEFPGDSLSNKNKLSYVCISACNLTVLLKHQRRLSFDSCMCLNAILVFERSVEFSTNTDNSRKMCSTRSGFSHQVISFRFPKIIPRKLCNMAALKVLRVELRSV